MQTDRAEARIAGGKGAFVPTFETGVCWGAFATLQNINRMTDSKNMPLIPMGCAPENNTRTQFIALFMEYARKNSQLLHEEFTYVAAAALKDLSV
jgi:hypothetical protein